MKKSVESAKEVADKMFTRYQHYYVYDKAWEGKQKVTKPVATVVVGIRRGTGKICRGISICSVGDNFDRREGVNRAIGRMIEAATLRRSVQPINGSIRRRMNKTKIGRSAMAVDRFFGLYLDAYDSIPQIYKCGYDVVPEENEKKILSPA